MNCGVVVEEVVVLGGEQCCLARTKARDKGRMI